MTPRILAAIAELRAAAEEIGVKAAISFHADAPPPELETVPAHDAGPVCHYTTRGTAAEKHARVLYWEIAEGVHLNCRVPVSMEDVLAEENRSHHHGDCPAFRSERHEEPTADLPREAGRGR